MKRWLLLLLLLELPAWAQGPRISVLVNGQPVAFDQPPIMVGGRVLVPLRGVFQQLGATVVYNPADRSINAQNEATSISLAVGQRTATVGGSPREMDTPPILVGGRALVPLRFLSQALGARVDWHPDRGLVTVNSIEAQAPPPPPSYGPLIQRVELSSRGPLVPGQVLHVRMLGAPGGQAHFDLGENRDIPMVEESPGRYEGGYTVRLNDHEREAPVVCHLHMPDGQRARQEGPWRVALGPPAGTWQRPRRGLIQNVTHNGRAPLYPGQILEVTMSGAPGGQATFGVGYVRNIPMREVSPGTYVGSWTVPPGPRNPAVPVIVRLRLSNGEQQDRRGANVNLMGGP
ncbi:MAG TPA: copper amine oxidase N-terminal domain-containing protein [Candidatus Xenobia bacterium]|jgi:hypothetical protein